MAQAKHVRESSPVLYNALVYLLASVWDSPNRDAILHSIASEIGDDHLNSNQVLEIAREDALERRAFLTSLVSKRAQEAACTK